MTSAAIVQKLWNDCDVLRDDGISNGEYVEQLTCLLFLKKAGERSSPPWTLPASGAHRQRSPVPSGYDWRGLLPKEGAALFDRYRHVLEKLGSEKGLLGLIFGKNRKMSGTVKPKRERSGGSHELWWAASLPRLTPFSGRR